MAALKIAGEPTEVRILPLLSAGPRIADYLAIALYRRSAASHVVDHPSGELLVWSRTLVTDAVIEAPVLVVRGDLR
jgi:hypothetical protein